MHGSVLGFFAYGALQGREVAGRDVLEVGSLDVNGSVRRMVEARGPASYTGIDVVAGPGVDLVADVEEPWKHWDQPSFDVVISTETMEHVGDWRRALASMVSVLRPGGVLIVTTRSPGFAYHHPPDRWRYTQESFAIIGEAVGLEPMVLMDDPEYPGVFWKVRKPAEGWDRQQVGVLRHLDVPGITPMREPSKWLALPANADGCGYYRMWQPWTQLERHSGHLVLIPPPGTYHDPGLDEDEVAAFDLVACQRPNGRRWLRDWKRWAGRTKLVYEADDNLLEPDTSGLPGWVDPRLQETVVDCLRLADLVTVSTEPLAELFRQHVADATDVRVIPNAIHEDLLTLPRAEGNPGRVTIGWAGGATHLQDIALLQQPLKELRRSTLNWDLHFLGMDYRPLFAGIGRYTSWQLDVWDYYRAIDFDIALCPLADTAFNRARSPIKALEMAALGIPVVASDIEPYRSFVVDGVTGYLVRTETDWRARLRELIHDEDARREMGDKARQVAREHTIQQHWRRWAAAYEEVCSD